MFICFQPTNHLNYTAIFSRRTGSQFAVSRQVGIVLLYGSPRFLVFVFSFVIFLVFVRFSHCNFYFYIVFFSQIVIVLVFVLTERSAINSSSFRFRYENSSGDVNTSLQHSLFLLTFWRVSLMHTVKQHSNVTKIIHIPHTQFVCTP